MSASLATSVSLRLLAGAALVVGSLGVVPDGQASAIAVDPGRASERHPVGAAGRSAAGVLDGFRIRYAPCGIGSPTDFEYEWEDVVFHSRVWETGPDAEGATKVDLMAKTIRGASLTDLSALRTFLTEYHEQPANWDLKSVRVGPYRGYSTGHQVFYFISPGVGAEVTIDGSRFSRAELFRTALGFRPE